jgi:predicted outer membrane repeat protein
VGKKRQFKILFCKRIENIPMKTKYLRFFLLITLVINLLIPSSIAQAGGVLFAKLTASGTGDCLSWANACTLRTALTIAPSGDEIWAAAGIHKPTVEINRFATFQLKGGVALYGGFAGTETVRDQRNYLINVTILSGDLSGNDSSNVEPGEPTRAENSYHVVTGATGATLDGFTISGGNANGTEFCTGIDCGGGMYNNASSPTLTNIKFSGNTASYSGGGLENVSNSNPTLTNVVFTNNSAYVGGGMDNLSGSSPILSNITISGNRADYGGGMYNWSGCNPTLSNATFSDNLAYNMGGGMYNYYSWPALTLVTFSNNTAGNYGGGMYNRYRNPTLMDVTFSGNSAAAGGGMSNKSSSPTLVNVTFNGNSAGEGGGLENHDNSNPALANVTFSGNSAQSGGGMYNTSSSPTLAHVTLIGNHAVDGGGLYNIYASPNLMDVTFSGNTADASGGGIFSMYGSLTLTNVTFSGNSSLNSVNYTISGGGAMYNWSCSPLFTNVTLSNNTAAQYGGGMFNESTSSPQIRNSVFWGNTASAGAQIFNSDSTTLVSDSVMQGGCPVGSTCSSIILTDPMLGMLGNYGGSTQTIPLLTGSSAIDMGQDDLCPDTDQRGIPRPQGAHCDIGAYEYVYPEFIAPLVSSSLRTDPSPTSATSVRFTVTFSESVIGVDKSDFKLTTTDVAGATVTGVAGTGSVYTITINTGSHSGTIRLDLMDDDTIVDLALNPLGGVGAGNGNFSNGEIYEISFNHNYLPLIIR